MLGSYYMLIFIFLSILRKLYEIGNYNYFTSEETEAWKIKQFDVHTTSGGTSSQTQVCLPLKLSSNNQYFSFFTSSFWVLFSLL